MTVRPYPYTILVDSREQLPYEFANMQCSNGKTAWAIATVVRGLPSGDYTFDGLEHEVVVERKSLSDLYGSLGKKGRDRFKAEFVRMNELKFAAVVIEAELADVFLNKPPYSRLSPKSVIRTYLAWSQRYTKVHWYFAINREVAERMTFLILDRYARVLRGEGDG